MSEDEPIIRILDNIEKSAEHIHEEARMQGNVVTVEEANQIITRVDRIRDWIRSERQLYD